MLNERLSAAKSVAAELFPAETQIEDAIVSSSRLAIAVVEGRRKAKLPITVGQDGLHYVAIATARMIEARSAIGSAHASLHEAQIEIGLSTFAFGDLWECPDNKKAMDTIPTIMSAVA